MAAQAVGSQMCKRKANMGALHGFALVPRRKAGQAQPCTEEFLASFCFINLAFLLKFQWGNASPFHRSYC